MNNLSQTTEILISRYQQWYNSLKPRKGISTIHVDEVASKVAVFYEKIRGIIDWREEHLLKRGAIERILKRHLFSKADLIEGSFSNEEVAEPLVLELIRAGYLANDKIEENKIKEVKKVIDKCVFILNKAEAKNKKHKKIQLYNWLCSISACEIEEVLSPSLRERALIDYMFKSIKDKIRFSVKTLTKNIDEEKKYIQTYIAVHKALFKLDSAMISYELLKYKYPFWKNPSQENLDEIYQNIYSIWDNIEKALNYPFSEKFYQICERYDTPYLLLGDILSENPEETKEKIKNPEILEQMIKKTYAKRLKTLKSRISRAAVYATLSIFLSKIVLLLAIEVPIVKYLTGRFDLVDLGINIFVPTFLMFFLISTTKPPPKGNLEKVIMETMKIVYQKKAEDIYEIKLYRKRGVIFDFVVNLLYSAFSIFIIGLIIYFLSKLNPFIFSHIILIIFISLIAFTGTKIRQRGRELDIMENRATFMDFIIDPLALPLIQLGNWLTIRWRKYNIIVVFFNALIDMPFMVFVEFIEQWRFFLKEKKEKIH